MTTNSTTVTHSLIHADCITAMQSMRSSSYELIFADPPYFLSSGGQAVPAENVFLLTKVLGIKPEHPKRFMILICDGSPKAIDY